MEFQKLEDRHIPSLLPYFGAQRYRISNYSAGAQFMWHKYLGTRFAEEEGCLILCDRFVGKSYFSWPLSAEGDPAAEERAVEALERHCRENNIRLHFTNVPAERLAFLVSRYGTDVHVSDIRRWRDYLYNAEDFRSYPGGKYSGQRNHVNKFRKNNPDWSFSPLREEDLPEAEAFLREYAASQYGKEEALATEEMNAVFALLPHIFEYGMRAGVLRAGGKAVALSVGEVCGDTMVVHVEKALRGYEGAYPMVAHQFALKFTDGDIKYLNRMDDAGDMGLRKSKLQYLPCEIVGKYNISPRRAIDRVAHLPQLRTERLLLSPVRDEDADVYARLAGDMERNRWWGYDWHEDAPSDTPQAGWFLTFARELFREKMEIPLGIYADGALVGEVVLHRFGYVAEAEIGMRLLPEAEGKGYAAEAVRALCEYALSKLELECVQALSLIHI